MKVDNITLMMFMLNFVDILELIHSSDFHEGRHVDACVEFCFLKK